VLAGSTDIDVGEVPARCWGGRRQVASLLGLVGGVNWGGDREVK
jgi:hypothetical protein